MTTPNAQNDLRRMRFVADDQNFSVSSSEWSRREFLKDRESAPDVRTAATVGEEFVPGFGDLQVDAYS